MTWPRRARQSSANEKPPVADAGQAMAEGAGKSGGAAAGGVRRVLIHSGGALNARVYRCEARDGARWIEKDFTGCSWLARNTVGRFLVWRECWILRRLQGTGVVPGGVAKISPYALREDFCPGFTLRDSCCGVHGENEASAEKAGGLPVEMLTSPVPAAFFDALERGIREAHRRGFAHLDLHNERNVIVGPEWRPVILDWQSALPLARVPLLGRLLAGIDLAGVGKFRERFRPGELDGAGRARMRRIYFWRRHFWFPRVRAGGH
ncbi:MAG: hypothetical protein IJP66_04570 [Kiritimatiellae bacterium]|nr:hypothetical protein [Kiritimatiellia bacterium]